MPRGIPSINSKIKRSVSNIWKLREFCKEEGGVYEVDYSTGQAVCRIGNKEILAEDYYVTIMENDDVIYSGYGEIKEISPDRVVIRSDEGEEEIEL